MKFGKNLQRVVEICDPEWAPYWVNYKMLKKLIKELPTLSSEDMITKEPNDNGNQDMSAELSALLSSIPSQKTNDSQIQSFHSATVDGSPVSLQNHASRKKEALGKSPGEVAFFRLLHAEFRKATRFFERATDEFTIRENRVREGMEILKRPDSILVNEKWSMLARSIFRLHKDLLLLETYAIMTYCSFSKILKKHDKVTGHHTRSPFMESIVNKANFTEYPEVMGMIRSCERLHSEVSEILVREGKSGLHEDERLFINMINRLNSQTVVNAESDGVHMLMANRGSLPMDKLDIPSDIRANHNKQAATLRSLLEDSEADAERSLNKRKDNGDDSDDSDERKETMKSPGKRQKRSE